MGRSVNYLNNAQYVTYLNVSNFGYVPKDESEEAQDSDNQELVYDEDLGREEYSDFKSEIIGLLSDRYTSLEVCKNEWDNRETEIILDNSLCIIGLSEYCGLCSVSIRAKDSDYVSANLAIHWINQVWDNMLKIINKAYPTMHLHKVGSFSNGEGVYSLVNQ